LILGNFGGKIPVNPSGMQVLKANGNWYGFLVGGTAGDYHLVRFDFGANLNNVPSNVVDFGDLSGQLIDPRDLYIFYENFRWNGVLFGGAGELYSLDFDNTLTNLPNVNTFGNFGGTVTGMWPMFDGSTWHIFYINQANQTVNRLDMGMALSQPFLPLTPTVVLGGATNAPFNGPRDISIIKDCSNYYGYVTNENISTLSVLNFGPTLVGIPTASNMGNFAGLNSAGFLTRFIRDKDNVFAFTANAGDNSISRLEYNSCVASSIPNYYKINPPPVYYSLPGVYNIYFSSDEGLPSMEVGCKQVTVLPVPIIELTPDTLICQRDTILLVANGFNLASVIWDPVYNARPPFDTTSIFVAPQEDFTYKVHLEFLKKGGCGYDRAVNIEVSKVTADAGPDLFIADGATAILGGPNLSFGQEYSYTWNPPLYLDKFWIANPTCKPATLPQDAQQYILTVNNDSSGCSHKDTMWVKNECTQINMPNVFNPNSDIPINRNFGLLNTKVVNLQYFKIFNRWGNLVFETTDPLKAWDGTQNNIELPSGNYVWIIDGYCDNGKRIRKQGTVLLVK
jgi:gliding motility-associated-like protein